MQAGDPERDTNYALSSMQLAHILQQCSISCACLYTNCVSDRHNNHVQAGSERSEPLCLYIYICMYLKVTIICRRIYLQFWFKTHFASTKFLQFVCGNGTGSTDSNVQSAYSQCL